MGCYRGLMGCHNLQFILLWEAEIYFPKPFDVFSFVQWRHLLSQLPAQRSQKRQFSSCGWEKIRFAPFQMEIQILASNPNVKFINLIQEKVSSPYSWVFSLNHLIKVARNCPFQLWTRLVKLKIVNSTP